MALWAIAPVEGHETQQSPEMLGYVPQANLPRRGKNSKSLSF